MLALSSSVTQPAQGHDGQRQPHQLAVDDCYQASMVPTSDAFPNVEDLSDCESDDESEDNNNNNKDHDSSITQPTKTFFLRSRGSKLITPRDLENGYVSGQATPSIMLGDDDDSLKSAQEKPEPKSKPLIPEINPLQYHGLNSSPLPSKKGSQLYRYLRWNFGSVYRRIFCLAFLGNITAIIFLLANSILGKKPLTYQQAATAVTVNILAAIVVRNEHVVNALFWIFGTWSKGLPFWARKFVAKIYSYGGIHSGGAVAATFWFIVYLVLLTIDFQSTESVSVSVVRSYIYFVSYSILFMLISMLVFAHPYLRVVMHNWFEGVHRFMGWITVILFWAQVLLLSADSVQGNSNMSLDKTLLISPNFWMLIVITLLVIYPWTRMRLREVDAEVLSDHCLKLNFSYRDVYYGQAVRLTDAPLKETHAFGVVPFPAAPKPTRHCTGCNCDDSNLTSPETPVLSHAGEKGFSVFISNAGDWTQKLIRNPPKKIYTRGTPQFGIFRISGIFKPCIIMATGSGIAPCLSLFVQHPEHPVRIIWSAPSPLETYGRAVVDLLYKVDPRAIIIDTRKTGRPDLVKIGYRVWEEGRVESADGEVKLNQEVNGGNGPCEALVIISNQKVTKKVVYGLETRGVPAYGALFDS